jgi:hypothetical protein
MFTNCILSPFSGGTYNISQTAFCLRFQVDPTQVGPVDRANLCRRRQNPVSETSRFK